VTAGKSTICRGQFKGGFGQAAGSDTRTYLEMELQRSGVQLQFGSVYFTPRGSFGFSLPATSSKQSRITCLAARRPHLRPSCTGQDRQSKVPLYFGNFQRGLGLPRPQSRSPLRACPSVHWSFPIAFPWFLRSGWTTISIFGFRPPSNIHPRASAFNVLKLKFSNGLTRGDLTARVQAKWAFTEAGSAAKLLRVGPTGKRSG